MGAEGDLGFGAVEGVGPMETALADRAFVSAKEDENAGLVCVCSATERATGTRRR